MRDRKAASTPCRCHCYCCGSCSRVRTGTRCCTLGSIRRHGVQHGTCAPAVLPSGPFAISVSTQCCSGLLVLADAGTSFLSSSSAQFSSETCSRPCSLKVAARAWSREFLSKVRFSCKQPIIRSVFARVGNHKRHTQCRTRTAVSTGERLRPDL